MDVLKALRELYLEKSRIDRLIAICESKIKEQDRRLSRSKRGRKSMSMEERQVVSERMRNYWASRREKTSEPETGSEENPADRKLLTLGAENHTPELAALAASSS